ncbi:MAG: hypothetical protein Q8O15_00025 [Rectinemataceae bacterium]|nr:hypothetical protein [Rectinemataceae bacterium]
MHQYRAFGMTIESELALALPPSPTVSHSQGPLPSPHRHVPAPHGASSSCAVFPEWRVSIGLGSVKHDSGLQQALGRIHYGKSGEDIQVEVPWAGRYRVRGDSRIVVEPEPGVDERTVGLYITGLVLSFLLRRRPFITLHGSAVTGPHGAIAFLGSRGSGKSTTAAALTKSGYEILCDDVIPVASGSVVFPGIPFPKLLSDAYGSLVGDPTLASHLFDGVDKYQVELAASHEPAPLRSIYILVPADVPGLGIVPLSGGAKVAALFSHVASSPGIDDSRKVFSRSIERLGAIPAFLVSRPIAGYSLPELIGEIVREDKGQNP